MIPHSVWLLLTVIAWFTGIALISRRAQRNRDVQASQENQAHHSRRQREEHHQGTAASSMCGLWQASGVNGQVGSRTHRPGCTGRTDNDCELRALAQNVQQESWWKARTIHAAQNITSP